MNVPTLSRTTRRALQTELLRSAAPPAAWADDRTREALAALKSMPEAEQMEWVAEFIPAAEQCDTEALDELAEALP